MPFTKAVAEQVDVVIDFSAKLAEGEFITEIVDVNVYRGSKSVVQDFDLANYEKVEVRRIDTDGATDTTEFVVGNATRALFWLDRGSLVVAEGYKVPGSEGVVANTQKVGLQVAKDKGQPGEPLFVQVTIKGENENEFQLTENLTIVE